MVDKTLENAHKYILTVQFATLPELTKETILDLLKLEQFVRLKEIK